MATPGSRTGSRTSADRATRSGQESREYIRGFGAACVNIVTTFPANKVMFRQQLHGINAKKAWRGIYEEGVRNLYRGVLPPLLQRSTSMALMFGLYDQYNSALNRAMPDFSRSPSGHHAICLLAALAAGSTEALLAPLERVQTLLQAPQYNGTFTGTYDAMIKLRSYGVREYYRGFTGLLLRNGPANAAFFLLRSPLKDALPHATTSIGNAINDFVSGALLGASISTVFYPINVVKTHMQHHLGGVFLSPWKAWLQVWESRGRSAKKVFRGVHVNFTRSLVSWGIINCTYEWLGNFV